MPDARIRPAMRRADRLYVVTQPMSSDTAPPRNTGDGAVPIAEIRRRPLFTDDLGSVQVPQGCPTTTFEREGVDRVRCKRPNWKSQTSRPSRRPSRQHQHANQHQADSAQAEERQHHRQRDPSASLGDGADIDPEPERRHGHHGQERRGMSDRRDRDGGHQPDRSVVRFEIWPMTSVDRRLSDR